MCVTPSPQAAKPLLVKRRKVRTRLWNAAVRMRRQRNQMMVNCGRRDKGPMADHRNPDRNLRDLFGADYVPDVVKHINL